MKLNKYCINRCGINLSSECIKLMRSSLDELYKNRGTAEESSQLNDRYLR